MTEEQTKEIAALLREIRDDQRLQLQRQQESLALQQQQLALVSRQFERAEKLNERAEMIQNKSAQIVAGARRVFMFVLPVIVILLAYVSWLILRRSG